jgi:uncharacterized membrane protein YeiH
LRAVLLAEVPTVLRSDLYAVAALGGAAVVAIGSLLRLPASAAMTIGATLCFGVRLMAIHFGWHLPTAGPPEQPKEKQAGEGVRKSP